MLARVLSLLLALQLPLALANNIRCPASILEKPAIQREEPAWTALALAEERPLESVGIYLGEPLNRGAQVPDAQHRGKGLETVSWRWVRGSADRFWLGCSYVGTSALLLQELDGSVTQCTVVYALLPSGKRQRLQTMACSSPPP